MPAAADLVGQRFGRLVVQRRLPPIRKRTCWECRCDCGRSIVVRDTNKLTSGHTRSCRCINADRMAERNTTHGKVGTREYRAWAAAKQRCFQRSHVAYARYGGRGITVCERWRDNFAVFLVDMGPCPIGRTLDRIDSNGHYEPANCRWATAKQQGANRRDNHYIEAFGRRMLISDWAKHTGISHATIGVRIRALGWPPERALTEPIRRR